MPDGASSGALWRERRHAEGAAATAAALAPSQNRPNQSNTSRKSPRTKERPELQAVGLAGPAAAR
eukprot:4514979-Prymnesium_polylepis.1